MPVSVALTIAGSDSAGGAGIQADLKTFEARGVFGASALTAITAQNTVGVLGVFVLPPAFVAQQIDAVLRDIRVDAVKTGMLATAEVVATVADRLVAHDARTLVVDPVMVAKSGDALLAEDARHALIDKLLPLALVVTPNLHEASVLTGQEVHTLDDMYGAARAIRSLGARNVVVKGGHLEGAHESIDVLCDGTDCRAFKGERIATDNTHGTGCTFASAIAAELAKGAGVPEAVAEAKAYVTGAIRAGATRQIGAGHGPVDHFWATRQGPSRADGKEPVATEGARDRQAEEDQ